MMSVTVIASVLPLLRSVIERPICGGVAVGTVAKITTGIVAGGALRKMAGAASARHHADMIVAGR